MPEDLEQYARLLEASGRYRVVRRFDCPGYYCDEPAERPLKGIFLDVETTGFNSASDRIIELAMVEFDYTPDGKVYRVGESFTGLQDPGKPLPEFITRLTGLSDEDLRGQRIDPGEVERFLDGAQLVVAHNADFDRPFFERAFPKLDPLPWACSVREVPWRELGVEGRKLEYIAYRCGVFFDGHRAEVDCQVGIHVLAKDWQGDGRTALGTLLESASKASARIWATRSPFEKKDLLKGRGYRFDGSRKVWYRDLASDAQLDGEVQWLAANVYAEQISKRGKAKVEATRVTARERYRGALEPMEELVLTADHLQPALDMF